MVRITWLKPEERIVHEFRQLREEGVDTSEPEKRWDEIANTSDLGTMRREALWLLDDVRKLRSTDAPDELPSTVRETQNILQTFDAKELEDRVLGGWTGRMAGCLLGKPVEKIPREGIRAILQSIDEWPLSQYFTAEGVPSEVTDRYAWNRASRPTSMRENIVCMPEDDDINYSMLNLHVLETCGDAFDTDDIATIWLQMMPVLTVFTAERVAYDNLLAYLVPPETALHRNPYREWIGAQIRADVWGWVRPGDPSQAAELAFRDGRLSHTGNGLYGEMFVAAMIAAAYVTDDVVGIIERGLEVVPQDGRFAEAIRFALGLPQATDEWDTAVDMLYERYGHYYWVHTINNAALLTAALIYGAGDFEKTICLAVMGGWDTDCNGATAGSIIGTMLGSDAIPVEWSAPLDNRVRSSVKGFDNSSIDDLARRTVAQIPERYVGAEPT